MAFQSNRIICFALLTMGASVSALANENLKLELEPVFQGNMSTQGVAPISADIRNIGPDTRGVLRVIGDGSQTDYPVDLPRGANKRIVTYPTSQYGDLHFELITDQGRTHAEMPLSSFPRGEGTHVLLIGDSPGELGFIAGTTNGGVDPPSAGPGNVTTNYYDCYAKPDNAPSRAVGYSGTSVIILGSGAERLTDDDVQAIKLWVSTGGTLMFVGGASAPILGDQRWADMLPAQGFKLAELKHSAVLSNLANDDAPTASVTTASPVQGATAKMDGSILLWADMPHGLGKTVFISFNPFDSPLSKWSGRRDVMTKIFRVSSNLQAAVFLDLYSVRNAPTYSGVYSGPSSEVTVPTHWNPIENDPFSMKLPPTERIFEILAGYFIVVVPLNFLVLKKLKRGELAWFTAPVISLGFAGLLFTSAGSLYSAKMSTVSEGVIVAQEGDAEGMFVGNTQMFIPRAGSYDLKLKNVDTLGAGENENYSMSGRGSEVDTSELDPIDVGEVEVPGMAANNLAFRRLTYRQRVPISNWFHVRLTKSGGRTAQCDVTNTGTYTLNEANLMVGSRLIDLGQVTPGQHKTIQVSFQSETPADNLSNDDARMFTLNKARVALTGTVDGFRPGPQIGESLEGRSRIAVAMFSSWNGGVK